MTKKISVTILLMVFISWATHNSVAQSSSGSSYLSKDERLTKQVSVNEIGIQASDLLKQLSSKKLIITCDEHISRIKLQIKLKNRSLLSLMRGLEELTFGRWRPLENQSGYILVMRTNAINDYKTWWRAFHEENENALNIQRKAILAAMRTPYKKAQSNSGEPIDIDNADELRYEKEKNFWNSIPQDTQEKIANQISEIAAYSGELSSGGGVRYESAYILPVMELPESARNALLTATTQQIEQFGYLPQDISVQFTNVGWSISTSLLLPNGQTIATGYSLPVRRAIGAETLTPFHREIKDTDSSQTVMSASRRKLFEYQKRVFWKNEPSAGKKRLSFRRVDALRRLGDQDKAEYISDYHVADGKWIRPARPDEMKQPVVHPIAEEMNSIAHTWDVSWKKTTDSLILIRNNRWYRDDLIEVPNSLIMRWLDKFTPQQKQRTDTPQPVETETQSLHNQMEWEAEIVTSLKPWQVAHGMAWFCLERQLAIRENKPDQLSEALFNLGFYPFRKMASRILREWNTAQFYASLNESQRNALIQEYLSLHLLSISQQNLLGQIIPGWKQIVKSSQGQYGLRLKRQSTAPDFTLIKDQRISVNAGVVLEMYPLELITKPN